MDYSTKFHTFVSYWAFYALKASEKPMAKTTKNKKFTFIDLFAGCGGLSEGFYRQGFKAVAHVEIDHYACETLRERMRYYGYKNIDKEVVEGDITSPDIISRIDEAVNGREVDMIIGGPPCQAYSTAGRVRDKKGMENDARNFLFESYVKILEHYLPKLFVFENVTGLFSAKVGGESILPKVISALGKHYEVISDPEKIVFNTSNYGVPQIRKRIILIGIRKDIKSLNISDIYNSITKTLLCINSMFSHLIPRPYNTTWCVDDNLRNYKFNMIKY